MQATYDPDGEGPGQGDPSFTEGDLLIAPDGEFGDDSTIYVIESIDNGIVEISAKNDTHEEKLEPGEVQWRLRNEGWGLEYVPEEGDRLEHHSFHLPGEPGETYEIERIFDHPWGMEVVELVCVSDRRRKDEGIKTADIASSVNSCSVRYGRGDNQRMEPVRADG
ncbi:hypothetical protein HLRTI_002900 [Halorhabdus tiamatea SARL4B]|uniref:Uncharacterized protein n=1 Tax=Halorhabdus tiamatea SARL4B TaxID=1033806 RepID=U2DZ88_9EURY|nr:hypothetical protein [Halorhabdus tiamatea]ERJ05101.1 hypothetical protein HLRTI_002900 [Halorhabdus tiamatea SARL4B]